MIFVSNFLEAFTYYNFNENFLSHLGCVVGGTQSRSLVFSSSAQEGSISSSFTFQRKDLFNIARAYNLLAFSGFSKPHFSSNDSGTVTLKVTYCRLFSYRILLMLIQLRNSRHGSLVKIFHTNYFSGNLNVYDPSTVFLPASSLFDYHDWKSPIIFHFNFKNSYFSYFFTSLAEGFGQ